MKTVKILFWIACVILASYVIIRFLAKPEPIKAADSALPAPIFPIPPGHPALNAGGCIITNR